MARRAYLGVDCGTQSTKAVLIEPSGRRVLGSGRAPHDIIESSDGTSEQHPDWWVEAFKIAVRAAMDEAGPVELAGVGISGQQHGLVCLDAADRPIRPAKLWNDTSTQPDADWLTRKLGGREAVLDLVGSAYTPAYTATKISWFHRSETENYAATRRFCLPHDYLNLWLTGEFGAEPGDASGTGYFDVRNREYAKPVLALLDGERDWSTSLPRVGPSRRIHGYVRKEVIDELGLSYGIPVSGGGGDNMCAAIGVGLVHDGHAVVSLGTSGTVYAYSAAAAVDPMGEVDAFCDSTGAWLPLACTLNCTGVTEWVRGLFGLDHAAIDGILGSTPPGAGGLTFLPYLAGERTPNAPRAAGSFVGLRSHHGRDEMVRAVFEGVTLGLAYGLDALRRTGAPIEELTLVGGGAASDAWGQLCADALGLPVTRADVVEAAATGAALQARWVVDGMPPPHHHAPKATWEPRELPELRQSADRLAAARTAAIG